MYDVVYGFKLLHIDFQGSKCLHLGIDDDRKDSGTTGNVSFVVTIAFSFMLASDYYYFGFILARGQWHDLLLMLTWLMQ